jgi:multimeric flavodoxin WrbA
MKVLGIAASPRGSRSQTLKLVQAVLDGAKSEGAEVELVDVCRLTLEYCNACDVCHKTGKCNIEDDFQGLLEKILSSDGLVWGSPNYFRSVTAQMKTMIDRMSEAMHCQRLVGKYSCPVATAGGARHDQVTDYLSALLLSFGSFVTGSVGASISQGLEAFSMAEKRAFGLGKALAEDIKVKRDYIEQREMLEENRKYFQALVKRRKEDWPWEYEYWNKLHWT